VLCLPCGGLVTRRFIKSVSFTGNVRGQWSGLGSCSGLHSMAFEACMHACMRCCRTRTATAAAAAASHSRQLPLSLSCCDLLACSLLCLQTGLSPA
jgi:hypothetical protein